MADDITIKVGFDGKAAQQGLGALPKAAQAAGNATAKNLGTPVEKGLDKMRDNAEKFSTTLLKRFFGISAAIGYFKTQIDAAALRFENMVKVSADAKKAGLGVEDFQRLTNISETTGTSMDSLAKAFETISDAVKNAKDGNLEAVESLRKLGFTQEQVRSGQLSSSAVLFQISQRYKQATTDAERLAIATGLLGSEGSKITPTLGMGTMEQQLALSDVSITANKANAAKAQADLVKRNEAKGGGFFGGIGDAFSSWWNDTGTTTQKARGKFGQFGTDAKSPRGGAMRQLEETQTQSKAAFESYGGYGESMTTGTKEERVQAFADMAADFKAAFTGWKIEGVTQTSEMVDAELKRKFAVLFPEDKVLDAVKKSEVVSNLPQAVSSMQAMGGGGGYYSGATTMVGIAEQQLSAAERTAAAVERIANGGVAPPAAGVVSTQ